MDLETAPKVFVVDDDPQMRKSLCRLLDAAGLPNEAFGSATEFLRACDGSQPGCLLLDVRMPEMSGLELQAELGKRAIQMPVIVVSGFADVPTAVQAIKRGAVDVLEKPFDDERLLHLIDQALHEVHEKRSAGQQLALVKDRLDGLTRRELEVTTQLAAGKSTKQIAREFGISSKTADIHRAHILEKLGLENVVQLANLYHQLQTESP